MAGALACPLNCTNTSIGAVRVRGGNVAYRYWCGECGFRTAWLNESQGQERQIEHYARRHPGIDPGGHVEVNRRRPGAARGCAKALGLVVLLLILAASCHGQW
jgi:hypothetical protein